MLGRLARVLGARLPDGPDPPQRDRGQKGGNECITRAGGIDDLGEGAIVGFVLGESWTEPTIQSLSVKSDGFVTTESEFLGEAADLDRNLLNLLVAAGVDEEERLEFERMYRERVDDWRPVLSGPAPATARLTRPDFSSPGSPA